ncbi:MAG: hypothetical protein H0V67_02465 [Geodermatophilaceae bacterium]|nr:hypothetical protein [Geodermatophilaceae bacterium]
MRVLRGALLAAAACAQQAFHVTLSLSPQPAVGMHGWHVAQSAAGVTVDLRMLLGHVAGAILMARVLTRGDAAVWSLYRAVHRSVRRIGVHPLGSSPVVADARPRWWAGVSTGAITGAGLRLAAATPYRGPPRAFAA